MEIKKFSELTVDILETIINKHYTHWSQFSPQMDFETTNDKFKNIYAKSNGIPFGIAMFDDNKLIGFCTLKMENLKKYPEIYPWISDVMIFDEFRGKGYGRMLIDAALQELLYLGYDKTYLWTDQAPDFYKKIGFTYLKEVEKNEGGFGQLFFKKTN